MEHKNINIILGSKPILISAPHAVAFYQNGNTENAAAIRPKEIYTKKIVRNICVKNDAWGIYTSSDGPLLNWEDVVRFKYKKIVRKLIRTQNIKLFIDVHGSKKSRPFTVDYDFIINDIHPHDEIIEKLLLKNLGAHIPKSKISKGFFRKINGPGHRTLTCHVRRNFGIPAVQIEINRTTRLTKEQLDKIISSINLTIKDYEDFTARL